MVWGLLLCCVVERLVEWGPHVRATAVNAAASIIWAWCIFLRVEQLAHEDMSGARGMG